MSQSGRSKNKNLFNVKNVKFVVVSLIVKKNKLTQRRKVAKGSEKLCVLGGFA
jgi:hypothetical protein